MGEGSRSASGSWPPRHRLQLPVAHVKIIHQIHGEASACRQGEGGAAGRPLRQWRLSAAIAEIDHCLASALFISAVGGVKSPSAHPDVEQAASEGGEGGGARAAATAAE